MGRRPTAHPDLPPGMRARVKGGVTYYSYDLGGKPRREIALGTNRLEAFRRWSELDRQPVPEAERATLVHVATRYRKDVLPGKATKTQREQNAQLDRLMSFFGDPPAPLAVVQPVHVRQYLDWRRDAPVAANREKALLSHMWNKAREWGMTDRANPCTGIEGFTEKGRADKLPSEAVVQAVREHADTALADAMDLAFLTGQRPADVRAMNVSQIRGGELWQRQAKTGTWQRFAITGQLEALLRRLAARRGDRKVLALLVDEHGQGISQWQLRYRFDKARAAAAKATREKADQAKGAEKIVLVNLAAEIEEFQFRDLRAAAGTEVAIARGVDAAQSLLGHASVTTTERYVRARAGKKTAPTR